MSKTESFLASLALRRQPFRTKRGSSVNNSSLAGPAATLSHEMRFECRKLGENCDFTVSVATPSHETRCESRSRVCERVGV